MGQDVFQGRPAGSGVEYRPAGQDLLLLIAGLEGQKVRHIPAVGPPEFPTGAHLKTICGGLPVQGHQIVIEAFYRANPAMGYTVF
ncbi:hypothetical protein AGMMS49587_07070 [Spirochaetia bacterium]|nr:hypothetical protein AGMMS49587_07070 [Spirochaetia bacterium]